MAAFRKFRNTLGSALPAVALALVFLILVAVPIEFLSLLRNAPSPIVEAHSFLWRVFFIPLELMPDWALDRVPAVNSPDPAIAIIPHLLMSFALWSLAFFVLILILRTLAMRPNSSLERTREG